MQRYLAAAAVFPSLYLALNASKDQTTVYAKSKSSGGKSSFSSGKSLFSSDKSSSSKSSSSSSSSSKSSSKQGKSLSQKSIFSSSSIAKKPYSKRNGNKMNVNKRRYVKDKKSSKEISIMGLIGLLGAVSVYFYRYEKIRYGIRHIKSAFDACQTTNLSHFNSNLQGKLIYGHGPLKIHSWQNKALIDPLFGVEASSNETLQLHRKVEVFLEDEKEERNGWKESNYYKSFRSQDFHPCMKDGYILPEKVEVGEYELSNKQLLQLGEKNQKQMRLDTESIDDYYYDLQYYEDGPKNKSNSDQAEEKKNQKTLIDREEVQNSFRTILRLSKEISEEEYYDLYKDHPFTYAIKNNKDIIFENDYIYISNNIQQPEEGDLRISFHELKPFLDATIIAQQEGRSFTDYEIEQFQDIDLNLRLYVNGKEQKITFNIINLIKDGKVDLKDMVKEYMTQTKKNARQTSYILASIICLIYVAIFDTVGQMMNPFNWFGKRAEERRQQNRQNVVQKRGNAYVFSKNNNASFLSFLFATPFAVLHVGSISIAAFARMYAGILGGGAVAGYLLYSLYQDQKDDYQLINSFSEDEEMVLDIDEHEEEVLTMLDNSEIEEK